MQLPVIHNFALKFITESIFVSLLSFCGVDKKFQCLLQILDLVSRVVKLTGTILKGFFLNGPNQVQLTVAVVYLKRQRAEHRIVQLIA